MNLNLIKTIIIVFIILASSIFNLMSSMDIDFGDVDVDGIYSDESYLNQDNGSQEYFINGSTEPGVNISATSEALNINNQKVQLTQGNNFSYKIIIPLNVSDVKVTLTAKKPGKRTTQLLVTIQFGSVTFITTDTKSNWFEKIS